MHIKRILPARNRASVDTDLFALSREGYRLGGCSRCVGDVDVGKRYVGAGDEYRCCSQSACTHPPSPFLPSPLHVAFEEEERGENIPLASSLPASPA